MTRLTVMPSRSVAEQKPNPSNRRLRSAARITAALTRSLAERMLAHTSGRVHRLEIKNFVEAFR